MANNIAYGFLGLEHLYSQRVTQVGTQRIYDAVRESLALHTETVNGIMRVFAEPTTAAQEQIELPGAGTLQPIGQSGSPDPVRPAGSYQVAYPIQGGATAFGTNRVSQQMLTVAEANRLTWDAQTKDSDWMIRHALAALFDNTTWTFQDDVGPDGSKGLGAITVQPLANGDTVTYLRRSGTQSTDTHYLAQANAISDTDNPFPAIKTELNEHPSNMGPYVVYVPTNLTDAIGGLTEFRDPPDAALELGADSDRVREAMIPDIGPGDELTGYLKSSKLWIVEWGRLPDNYMIAVAQGSAPPLKMRQYPVPALQGFFTETFNPEAGLTQVNMIRYAGFGASNRVGAVVQRIGNASYAIPNGYTTPLQI